MYRRIIILGGSGSGKSTLANKISLYTDYPVYHLDNILLNPDWEMKDKSEWEEISKQFLSKDVGVVDGNFTTALPNRINWADLIIFIDVPARIQLYRMIRRYIRIKLGLDIRYGNPERFKEKLNIKFILWVYNWNNSRGEKILSMLENIKDKKVVIINNPKELDIKSLLES